MDLPSSIRTRREPRARGLGSIGCHPTQYLLSQANGSATSHRPTLPRSRWNPFFVGLDTRKPASPALQMPPVEAITTSELPIPMELRGPHLRELININRDTTVHRLTARITALFRAHMPLPSHGIGSNYGRKRTPAPCGYSSLAILSRFSQLPNDASKTTGDQDCALSLERPRCRVKSSLIADLPIRPRSLKRDSAVHFQALVQTSLRNGVVESVQNGGGGGGAGLECYFLQDSNDTKLKS